MQGIFRKENTDKALKYGIYRHLPTYEKIIRNLVNFSPKNTHYLHKNMKKMCIVQYNLNIINYETQESFYYMYSTV